jgi:quercetin dioxygenase-like cupin family protein
MTDTIFGAGLGQFVLADEIERFAPGPGASGRRAEILVKRDGLRVVLITMRAGAALQEHTAPGPITLQALRGRFRVSVERTEGELAAGVLITIAAGVPHAVRAVDDGAFLLTIGGSSGTPNMGGNAAEARSADETSSVDGEQIND